jgi:uncharacterized coiled-coil protein SlyX
MSHPPSHRSPCKCVECKANRADAVSTVQQDLTFIRNHLCVLSESQTAGTKLQEKMSFTLEKLLAMNEALMTENSRLRTELGNK